MFEHHRFDEREASELEKEGKTNFEGKQIDVPKAN